MRSGSGGGSSHKNYQDCKNQILQTWFVSGAAKLDKKSFKQITRQFKDVVDVDSRNASQLWQMVEEDTQGMVNRSYLEEIFDVVHEQQLEKQDLQFELTDGLRYVHQTVFKNPDTYRVSLQDCIPIVQKAFTNGHQQIIAKLSSIARNSQVDRVEFMELIENLEQKQLYQAIGEHVGAAGAGNNQYSQEYEESDWLAGELNEDEEYSEAKDREILGQLRVRVESIVRELEKANNSLRTTNPTLLKEAQNLARPVPNVLKFYGNYTKQIHLQLERLRLEAEALKSTTIPQQEAGPLCEFDQLVNINKK